MTIIIKNESQINKLHEQFDALQAVIILIYPAPVCKLNL